MAAIASEAAQAVIRDLDGNELPLARLWAEKPVVLAFVRHFGCLFCREQATELHREKDRIHAAGAELAIVGNGNRHFAQGFAKELGLTTPLYVDTERGAYKALGLKRSFTSFLNLATLRNLVRALRSGFRQGRTQGDPWQLGGVLVVRPGGDVVFRHASDASGDHPPAESVLSALEATATR